MGNVNPNPSVGHSRSSKSDICLMTVLPLVHEPPPGVPLRKREVPLWSALRHEWKRVEIGILENAPQTNQPVRQAAAIAAGPELHDSFDRVTEDLGAIRHGATRRDMVRVRLVGAFLIRIQGTVDRPRRRSRYETEVRLSPLVEMNRPGTEHVTDRDGRFNHPAIFEQHRHLHRFLEMPGHRQRPSRHVDGD